MASRFSKLAGLSDEDIEVKAILGPSAWGVCSLSEFGCSEAPKHYEKYCVRGTRNGCLEQAIPSVFRALSEGIFPHEEDPNLAKYADVIKEKSSRFSEFDLLNQRKAGEYFSQDELRMLDYHQEINGEPPVMKTVLFQGSTKALHVQVPFRQRDADKAREQGGEI